MVLQQKQQEKQQERVAPENRLQLLEIILGLLHLFAGAILLIYVVWVIYKLYPQPVQPSQPWYRFVSLPTVLIFSFCTTLAAVLLLCRQRRAARWLQWGSALASLCLVALVLYRIWERYSQNTNPFYVAGYILLSLWMFWFAKFLKQREGESS
ncbi:hypothetical protein [Armatimonas sp.]|uniref:hypothetical protein n=1 Tax=Armatimonas sp. TaxID=1872638 RepID=UPI003753534B